MAAFIDLTGRTFSRLTVIERNKDEKKFVNWKCLCICGKITFVRTAMLNNGGVKSCGCYHRERITTHGYAEHTTKDGRKTATIPEYGVWQCMKDRCNNKNNKAYPQYGARGISVCDRWNTSFVNFLEDMGRRPDRHVLDRIDPNGNYEPLNCRWVTAKVSTDNRRITIWLEFDGIRLTISDWAKKLKVPTSRLLNRYRAGLTVEEILFKPPASVRFREALDHKTRQSALVSADPSRSNIHQLPAHGVLDLSHLKKFADVELYIY